MTTWVKVLNTMPANPKVLAAGDRAAWLFVCGLCYANEHLTDGYIPRHALPVVAPGVKSPDVQARRLVDAGLWHLVDGGWRVHDYGDHQRSAEEIRERRQADADRKARARSARSPTRTPPESPNGSPHGQTADSPPDSAADSARNPVGVRSPEGRRQRAEGREQIPAKAGSRRARRAATRQIDQTRIPDEYPPHLLPVLADVLPILRTVWELRGGREPQPRGVALAVMRQPRADHRQIARRLEHWLTAGRGQRASSADIAARYGDWVAGEDARQQAIVVPMRRETASDWLRDDFIDGEPITDATVVDGEAS